MFKTKRSDLFFIVVACIVFLTPLVSAQYLPSPNELIKDVVQAIEDIFSPIFVAILGQDYGDDSSFLFYGALLILLLFVVIYSVLQRVPMFEKSKGVAFVVAAVVSILGMRFIPQKDLIQGILLPYGTLAIAITTFLPFLIYFWFVHDSTTGSFGRRTAWIFYGIIFIFLSISRRSDISWTSYYIYLSGILAVAISFFFDKQIHGYFGTAAAEKRTRAFKLRQLADLEHDIQKYRRIDNPSRRIQQLIEDLERRYRTLSQDI